MLLDFAYKIRHKGNIKPGGGRLYSLTNHKSTIVHFVTESKKPTRTTVKYPFIHKYGSKAPIRPENAKRRRFSNICTYEYFAQGLIVAVSFCLLWRTPTLRTCRNQIGLSF